MKMLFRQRLFSWLDSYDVYGEDGSVLFVVKGALGWKHCLKIFTPDGREAGMVRERWTWWKPRFDLTAGGRAAGCITKEITLLRPRFTLDFRHWEITGDWLGWNCRIMDGSACVAVITKRLWKLTDTCGIDVVNPDDVPGTLMVVLAINAVKCSQRQ